MRGMRAPEVVERGGVCGRAIVVVVVVDLPPMRTVVFDCESDGLPTRCGGLDFTHVECTVACALLFEDHGRDPETATPLVCWRDDDDVFEPLFRAFDDADRIVGYNVLDFDFPLLQKYYGVRQRRRYVEHRVKTIDLFHDIRATTGVWLKLNVLLNANEIPAKSSSGSQAVAWWESGERSKLEAYCMTDVRLTATLAALPSLLVPVFPGEPPFVVHPAHARTALSESARSSSPAARKTVPISP